MKDHISKYVKENRENLDTHIPAPANWDAIEGRLHGEKENKKILIWISSIAAAFLVLFTLMEVSESKSELVSEASYVEEETGVQRINPSQNIDVSSQVLGYNGNGSPSEQAIYSEMDVVSATTHTYAFKDSDGSIASTGWTATSSTTKTDDYSFNKIMPLALSQKTESKVLMGAYNMEEEMIQPEHDVSLYYEQYDKFIENAFESPLEKPLSTFGIDVDGAGYSNVRRYVSSGYIPPKGAVKLEEMINYFNYDLREPSNDSPISITTEVGVCPWEEDHLLMQIALKGKSIDFKKSQSNNLVFLIDVSGSMSSDDKLPLLKKSLKLAVKEMGDDDRIAIVVYAGAAGLVLPSTSAKYKSKIYDAIENLESGGSTAGGAGIELAYKTAQKGFLKNGNNRILLATDGDFNVGASSDESMIELIERKRESGVFLSVLGFGTGNLQSSKIEKIADNGNGNYYYIDNINEAKKVLVNEIGGTMVTIAKDVKLQLEFNQDYIKSYRLIGYENRILSTKDFDDDTKDAGDLGSGHTVVAMYELIKQDSKTETTSNLRYQQVQKRKSTGKTDELAFVKFRYKDPKSSKSKLIKRVIKNEVRTENSQNFLFASAVAEFGMLMRESKHRGNASFNNVYARAQDNLGKDKHGYRSEFLEIVEAAQELMWTYYSSDSFKGR